RDLDVIGVQVELTLTLAEEAVNPHAEVHLGASPFPAKSEVGRRDDGVEWVAVGGGVHERRREGPARGARGEEETSLRGLGLGRGGLGDRLARRRSVASSRLADFDVEVAAALGKA